MRRCRQLTGETNALERELAVLVADYAPQLLELKGCGVLIAAKLIGENDGVERFRTRRSSPDLPGSRQSTARRASSAAIDSTAMATAS